ncbi:MAG: hypothetical protein D6772_06625 [Bacteroidetes bacterium]|nr:MAG: hypothetical protein D6772_06625 [Bacteroidota bacterium]
MTTSFLQSLQSFGHTFMSALPRLLGALVIVLVGWFFARLASRMVASLLTAARFNKLADRIRATEMLQRANLRLTASELFGRFVYWLLMLMVIITTADTLGWTAVSQEISKLLAYLPQLLSAIVFFIVGIYIATFIRDVVAGATRTLGISAGRIVSNVVYVLLFLLVLLTTLEQAGIDTSVLTSNLLLIVGAVMAAAAISYGFASRVLLSNILASFFSRKNVRVGQVVEIDGQRGEVVEINNIAIVLRLSATEKLVVPAQDLISKPIRIIEE